MYILDFHSLGTRIALITTFLFWEFVSYTVKLIAVTPFKYIIMQHYHHIFVIFPKLQTGGNKKTIYL